MSPELVRTRSMIVNDEAEIEDGEEEELDLSTLDDDDLVKQMHDDLYDGLREEIEEGTNILLARGWQPKKLLDEALVEGMRIVGIDFRDGILFVPEVLLAANAMKGGMEILRPLLAETGAPPIGKAPASRSSTSVSTTRLRTTSRLSRSTSPRSWVCPRC